MPKNKKPLFIYRPRTHADGTPGLYDGELVIDISYRWTKGGPDLTDAYALLANGHTVRLSGGCLEPIETDGAPAGDEGRHDA